MKVDTKVSLAVALAIFGAAAVKLSGSTPLASFFEYLFTPFITLIAAFSGSWYAFKLQNERSDAERIEKNVEVANSTIFELARWYNIFHGLKSQLIEEHLESPSRHIYIKPTIGLSSSPPNFKYDSLSFLFRSKNPNLLGTLSLTEQEIATTLDVIHKRSNLHFDVLQPAVESLEAEHPNGVPVKVLEQALGPRTFHTLKTLTDQMITGVDDSLSMLQEHIDCIKKETSSLYPGHTVIGMTYPPAKESADRSA